MTPTAALARRLRPTVRALVPDRWRLPVHFWLQERKLAQLLYYRERRIIAAELASLSHHVPWSAFTSALSTRNCSERVVEVPWVLGRCAGHCRILDIGSAFALPVYLRYLTTLPGVEVIGVDLSTHHRTGLKLVQADVRRMPFRDESFDLITCLSTLEHIGLDNTRYGVGLASGDTGDTDALIEMRRVVRRGASLLVTVPFGTPGSFDWFRQYDTGSWRTRVVEAGWRMAELTVYRHFHDGWRLLNDPRGDTVSGYGLKTPAAAAVLCARLLRP